MYLRTRCFMSRWSFLQHNMLVEYVFLKTCRPKGDPGWSPGSESLKKPQEPKRPTSPPLRSSFQDLTRLCEWKLMQGLTLEQSETAFTWLDSV